MTIVTVGIDLAKNIFPVHGVNAAGKSALVRSDVSRAKLLELIAKLPPCLIGMEACGGAHHWCREFAKFGHTVRMMAPKFVVPYRTSGKRGKNDAADAAAIAEAVTRPNMRFVPVKSIEQQSRLFVHRARQGYGAGVAGPQRRKHHHGLHACAEGRSGWRGQPAGFVEWHGGLSASSISGLSLKIMS